MLKTRIPFANVKFIDDMPSVDYVTRRFTNFLRDIRFETQQANVRAGLLHEDQVEPRINILSSEDKLRISNRAIWYVERVKATTGMSHLDRTQQALIEPLRLGVMISRVPSEHDADVIAAALHEEMPWLAPATEQVWNGLRQSVRDGLAGYRFPPLLMVGPPGIGKSHFARHLATLLEVPSTIIEVTGEPASFSLVGSQHGWGSAAPGKLMQTILRDKSASPIVIVDEVEKAGRVQSNGGTRYALTEALLPLLEPLTAKQWGCPYFRIQFDMSWVGWVMTANSLKGMPEPLLSRCPPLLLPPLSQEQLIGFIRCQSKKRGLTEEMTSVIEEVAVRAPNASLRTVMRLIDKAEMALNRPVLH